MPRIKFTSDPKIPRDKVNDWKDYIKDSKHEVSLDEADRWISRGVAEEVREKQKVEEVKSEVKPEIKSKIELEEVKIEIKEEEKTEVKPEEVKVEIPNGQILPRSIPRR